MILATASQCVTAQWTWNGTFNSDWFVDGNWQRSGSGDNRRILKNSDVVISAGIASGRTLTHFGHLLIDGTAGPAELKMIDLTLSGSTLAVINGGVLTANSSIYGSASLGVSGIHADGRRSTVSGFLNVGQWGGDVNVVHVDDGGLIQTGELSMPGHTFARRSHSTLVVSGVHASGVASTVEADSIVLGRIPKTTAEIQVLDGGILNVKSLTYYHSPQIRVSGSAGPDHRSTLTVESFSGVFGTAEILVLDGGTLKSGDGVVNAKVSGTDRWGNASLVEAKKNFGGNFIVEKGGIVMTPRLFGSPDGAVLSGKGKGSSAIHMDRMENYDEGGFIRVNGGTFIFREGGSLSGEGAPVSTRIGKRGLWVETDKHVVVNGPWTEGTGGLTKSGTGMLELNGLNSHAGGTTIETGTLLLGDSGVLGSGPVNVLKPATLSGTGRIGGDLFNQGTLSPGQSPGTLVIDGSFRQSTSGQLILEVDALGNNDLLLVGGNAKLGGSLAIQGPGGKIEYGGKMTLLRATTVKGAFDEIDYLGFDGTRVGIVSEQGELSLTVAPLSYTEVATNRNERNVAAALDVWIADPSGDRQNVVQALDSLSAAEYRSAFAAISPSWIHATDEVMADLTRNQQFLLDQRLSARWLMRDSADDADRNEWDPWSFAHGMFSNEHSLSSWDGDLRSGGLVVGMDRSVNDSLLAGGFLAFGAGELDATHANETTVRNFASGIYATYEERGFHGNATLGLGYLDQESNRSIRFGGLRRVARADDDGMQVFGSVSGGYSFEKGAWKFGPAAALFADWMRFDSVQETGAGSLNLRVDDRESESLRGMIGFEASYEYLLPNRILLVPQASLFWIHECLDDQNDLHSSFEGGAGPSFKYRTSAASRDSAMLSTTLNVVSPWDYHGAVGYHVEFTGDGGVDHTIMIGFDKSF